MTLARYVDAHCHVDRYRDPRQVLKDAADSGVVTVAVTEAPSDFQRQHALLRRVAGARVAIGMHPLAIGRATPIELSLFRRLVDRTDYVGEVGLDFSREGAATKSRQIEVFEALLSHPAIPRKVLTVHSRRAEADVIERLATVGATGILHWYSGPVRLIDAAASAGLYFSINPAMLRSRNGQRIIATIPRERTLTETDGPYTKVQSRIAEPKDVPWLVEQLARVWGQPATVITDQIFSNMATLFAARESD